MTARTLVLLLVMVCGFVTPLVGGTPGLAEFRVSVEDDPAFFGSLDTDADADGSFTVVCDTWEPGWFMRLFASTGQPTSDVIQLETCDGWAVPAVARLSDGHSVVVWRCDWTIFARRFSGEGQPFGEVFRVSSLSGWNDHPIGGARRNFLNFAVAA